MKKIRMIVSAAVVFAAVSGALAFTKKINPDLYICSPTLVCVPKPLSSFWTPGSTVVPNPGYYFIANPTGVCGTPGGLTCSPYPATSLVYTNN